VEPGDRRGAVRWGPRLGLWAAVSGGRAGLVHCLGLVDQHLPHACWPQYSRLSKPWRGLAWRCMML
jgi:hypothetical protein